MSVPLRNVSINRHKIVLGRRGIQARYAGISDNGRIGVREEDTGHIIQHDLGNLARKLIALVDVVRGIQLVDQRINLRIRVLSEVARGIGGEALFGDRSIPSRSHGHS